MKRVRKRELSSPRLPSYHSSCWRKLGVGYGLDWISSPDTDSALITPYPSVARCRFKYL